MKQLFVVLLLIGSAQVAVGASPYVRVLLPLYATQPVPGAFGSLWQSQFVLHNGSPSRSYAIVTCLGICQTDLTSDKELLPGETQVGLPPRYPTAANSIGGAVLYMFVEGAPADHAEDVALQLRVADLSRSAIAAGTEMLVVRENEFRTSTIHLLNVPTNVRFRLALRLFEMNLEQAEFAVRVVDQTTNAILTARQVTTLNPDHLVSFTPGFVSVDLLSGISVPPGTVRVEIEPRSARAAFWSYVSITNNESQQFTMLTPQ